MNPNELKIAVGFTLVGIVLATGVYWAIAPVVARKATDKALDSVGRESPLLPPIIALTKPLILQTVEVETRRALTPWGH